MGKIIIGIITLTGFIIPSYLIIKEVGEYTEEINPHNSTKNCDGCLGTSIKDCENCDEVRRHVWWASSAE